MKVPAQTSVVMAALSVAGSLASNVESSQKRQLTGLPFVVSPADPLTAEQKDSLDSLTKGLNGATPSTASFPNPAAVGLPDLPIGVGASNLPDLAQAGKIDPATVSLLIQQNQQLIGLLSAYLPAQAHSVAGGVAGVPSQLGNVANMLPIGALSPQAQGVLGGLPSQLGNAASMLPMGQLPPQVQGVLGAVPGQLGNTASMLPMGQLPPQVQALTGLPGQLGNAAGMLPMGSLPLQIQQLYPQMTGQNLYGSPSLPVNLPAQGQDPWHLVSQFMPQTESKDGQSKDHSEPANKSKDQNPDFNSGHPWSEANNLVQGTPLSQVMPKMPLSADTLPLNYGTDQLAGEKFPNTQASNLVNGVNTSKLAQKLPLPLPLDQAQGVLGGVTGDQLGQSLPFSQVGALAGNLPLDQLPQGLPLSQAGGGINSVGQNLPVPQAGGVLNGVAKNLPVSQASGVLNGVTDGPLGQNLPLSQAQGLVNGVAQGQLPQGLPVQVPNAGGLLSGVTGGNGGAAGGLLSHLLGPLNLHRNDDDKNKHSPQDAVQSGTDMLASATAWVQGGPTGALNVPALKNPGKIGGHQLNEDASSSSSPADSGDPAVPSPAPGAEPSVSGTVSLAAPTAAAAAAASKVWTSSWSAPSLVRTASHISSLAAPETSKAPVYSAAPTWATSVKSAALSSASSSAAATAAAASDKDDDEDGGAFAAAAGGDGQTVQIRAPRREWTWVAPRHDDYAAGRFLPRGNGGDAVPWRQNKKNAASAAAAPLVSATADVDPLLDDVLATNQQKLMPPPTRHGSSGPGRARMAIKKGKGKSSPSSSSSSSNGKEYEVAKDALIKAEASLWEAEHPDGLSLAVGDAVPKAQDPADKNGSNKKGKGAKKAAANPLWAWIGTGSGPGAAGENEDGSAGGKAKKGKKKGVPSSSSSSSTFSSASTPDAPSPPPPTTTGPSFAFPASLTASAAGPLLSASLTVSAPIKPTLKGTLFGP